MINAMTTIEESPPRGSAATGGQRLALVELLCRLTHDLAQARDGTAAAGPSHPAVERWQDDDYIYLEAELSDSPELEADISVKAGHAFIRIAIPAAADPEAPTLDESCLLPIRRGIPKKRLSVKHIRA